MLAQRILRRVFSSVKIKLTPCETFKLDGKTDSIPTETTTTKEECLNYLKEMEIMRFMELGCETLYHNKEIRGFLHLYDGQEAIPEGMHAALTFQDPVIASYRVHCLAYKRGYSVRQIMAEMMWKQTGATCGKGGSMHIYHKTSNFYGGNSIVGAQVPVGTGIAFALKYQKKKNVCVTIFGDGAANQGQLFESANMAFLWKLPLIFMCENNLYALGTSVQRSSMNTRFYTRGDAIPGIRVDGNDVFAVREIMKWSKDYCIGDGPLFMQMMTYRYHGHSMSDAGLIYRSKQEIAERRKKDPIVRLKNIIADNKLATEDEMLAISASAKKHVDDAIVVAKADPVVSVSELTDHVYADNNHHYIRGVLYEESHIPHGQKY